MFLESFFGGGGKKPPAKPELRKPSKTEAHTPVSPAPQGDKGVESAGITPDSTGRSEGASVTASTGVTEKTTSTPLEGVGIPHTLRPAALALARLFVGEGRTYPSWNQLPQEIRGAISLFADGIEAAEARSAGFGQTYDGKKEWNRVWDELASLEDKVRAGSNRFALLRSLAESDPTLVAKMLAARLTYLLLSDSQIQVVLRNMFAPFNVDRFPDTSPVSFAELQGIAALLKTQAAVRDSGIVQEAMNGLTNNSSIREVLKAAGIPIR